MIPLIHHLYPVKLTQIEMMADRGFLIPEHENTFLDQAHRDPEDSFISSLNQLLPSNPSKSSLLDMLNSFDTTNTLSEQSFLDYYLQELESSDHSIYDLLTHIYDHSTKKSDYKTLVAYAHPPADGAQLGLDALSSFINVLNKISHCKHLIIITPVPLTPPANKKLKDYPAFKIEVFLEKDLTFNVTKHKRVPRHLGLSPFDSDLFITSNNLNPDHLQILLTTDPVSRYYGFTEGQIVEIHRINLLENITKNYDNFRIVQKPPADILKLGEENKRKVESHK